MKKLALAPAVAIAITGLAASPVIAAPGSVNYSHSVVKNSGDAQESTASESPEADAQAIEAKVTTSPKEITAEDLANKDKGIVVTITGLEAGDKISDSLTGEAGTAEGDNFEYNIYSTQPAEDIENGTVDFSVTITRDGEQRTYDGLSFNVVDDTDEPEAPEADPKVSLNTDEISQSDFAKNGITVTGEGFTPGGKVTVVGGTAQSPFATKEVEADNEGKVSATLKFEGDDALPAGDYTVWGVDQATKTNSPAQGFTITEDKTEDPTTPAEEATLTVSPSRSPPLTSSRKTRVSPSPSRTASPVKTSASSLPPRANRASPPSTRPFRLTTKARPTSTSTAPARPMPRPTSAITMSPSPAAMTN
ncbi:hypothetical protein SAMN04489752_0911 [Brevibacterium siliguriense]|uniref:Uncharacterized protein n=1 Tax=Brevibacterium siliguriense TaxID=1136497 RepID=A0A1H1P7A8_9MICO|nr:hypothetical protein [Brevibacterium siliguriense]SDS06930.1 hypothetical protein SAMN04489752_0911 [Brevibacterium siliguriense]